LELGFEPGTSELASADSVNHPPLLFSFAFLTKVAAAAAAAATRAASDSNYMKRQAYKETD
jgi:hypothetical protein